MSRKGLACYTLATFITIFCLANTAFAADVGSKSGSFYVGGGISSVGIQYKTTIKARDGSEGNANGKANTVGAFIDAGYKISLNKFYIAPEIFLTIKETNYLKK